MKARVPAAVAAALALALLGSCAKEVKPAEGDAAASAAPVASSTPEPSAATATPAATASPAASSAPGEGPRLALGNGQVWAYVNSDSAGKPTEVGVRLNGAALEGLPQTMTMDHPVPMILTFPSGVASGVLDHVEFYWNPTGHEPPGVWDKPHFDYHFFMVDQASARAVDPANADFSVKSAKVPDPKYVPTDFVPPPGTPSANTIPGMGLHWLDQTEPPVPGEYKFTETMINGSYDGVMTFIEPMITREWLLSHPSLDEPLKQPQAYQRAGLWPTKYTVRYDSAKDEYSVALVDFTERQAS